LPTGGSEGTILHSEEPRLLAACTPDSPTRSCLGVLAAVSAVSRFSHPTARYLSPDEGAVSPGGEHDPGGEPPVELPKQLREVLPGILGRATIDVGGAAVEEHGKRWIRRVTAGLLVCHPQLLGPLLKQLPLVAAESSR
jgi:hypothetical protein